jgi:hypothetical protein
MTLTARRRLHIVSFGCMVAVVPFLLGLMGTAHQLEGVHRLIAELEGALFAGLLLALGGYTKVTAAAEDSLSSWRGRVPSGREMFYRRAALGLVILGLVGLASYLLVRGRFVSLGAPSKLRELTEAVHITTSHAYGLVSLLVANAFVMLGIVYRGSALAIAVAAPTPEGEERGLITSMATAPKS